MSRDTVRRKELVMGRVSMRLLLLGAALLMLAAPVAGCGSGSGGSASGAATPAGGTAAFAAGDSVAARWTDGSLYLATVESVEGDQVAVTYADDGSTATVAAADVRAIPATTFSEGDRVLAVWSKGRFYAGKVTKANGSSYVIAWDDGSTPSTVAADRIIAE
jgi:hypothetical protein